MGPWGLGSPPAAVLCDATTAPCPSRGPALVARSPIPCVLPSVCGLPAGLVAGSKRPDNARAFGHPLPQAGNIGKEPGGSPKVPPSPCEDMPRSQTPVGSCALAKTPPGRLPSSHWKPSASHDSTHCGAPARRLSPCYPRLRTAPDGEARGGTTDRRARLASGRTCTLRCSPPGAQQPISWSNLHSQGFGLPLARPVPGSA